jgi:hypothetical protein
MFLSSNKMRIETEKTCSDPILILMMKIIFLPSIILFYAVMCLIIPVPALCLDQVIRLYICQTEHDLDEITAWEYSAPEKYREVTKNGKMTPLDAARDLAGNFVASDKIQCNSDNQVVIERYKSEGGQNTVYRAPLNGPELEKYCPRTVKKYGNLCTP